MKGRGAMRNRILLVSLYATALLALAFSLGIPLLGYVFLIAGAIPGTQRRMPPLARFITELVLIGLATRLIQSPLGLGLQLVMAMAALSIAAAEKPSVDRAIFFSLVLTTAAAFIKTASETAYVPLAALSVWALVEGGDGHHATRGQRTRLAATLAAIAAVAAIVIALLVRLLPWQSVVAVLFSAVAYPFLVLASRFRAKPHIRGLRGAPGQAARSAARHLHPHAPILLTAAAIGIGIVIIVGLLLLAYHHWARNEELPQDLVTEAGIVRESLTDLTVNLFSWHNVRSLTPVRRFVRGRLRHAFEHASPKHPSETLREWLNRPGKAMPSEVVEAYESIRYGNQSDTADKYRLVKDQWPEQ